LEGAGESKLRILIGNYETLFFDEAQRIRDIGLILKIIHDQMPGVPLVVSSSSALDIANHDNEPLTGRKWEYTLFPLSWNELTNHFGHFHVRKNLYNYLIYGTYPEVVTHTQETQQVLQHIAGCYLYKDILQFQGIRKPEVLDKILLALALQLRSEVNINELSRTIGINRSTVEQYVALLEKAMVVFRVQPLARNVRNEVNTSRKVYFYDNGIRNEIIGNFKMPELRQDIGALWENFVISERMKAQHYQKWYGRNYFWRTYQQQEIDWIEELDGTFSTFEFKWNPLKKSKKMSITFLNNYPVIKSMVVTPEKVYEFLSA
jgi:uncharacterized protein